MHFQRLASTLVAVSLCLSASGTLVAQAGRPPIIDRQLFFGNPEISGAMLSPDGRYVAFLKPYKDTRNIWVKRTEEPFDNARLVTADTKRPIPAFFWSRDSKYILFVQDQGGDENYNVFAVDPAEHRAGRRRRAAVAQSHRRQGGAGADLLAAEDGRRRHLRRPERSRRRLARPVSREDFDRRADARAPERRQDRRLALRSAGTPAPRAAGRRQRRYRDPERDRRRLHESLRVHGVRDVRADAVP